MQEQVASSIASGGDHILYSGGVTSMASYISHVSGMATLSRRVRMTHNHESKGHTTYCPKAFKTQIQYFVMELQAKV